MLLTIFSSSRPLARPEEERLLALPPLFRLPAMAVIELWAVLPVLVRQVMPAVIWAVATHCSAAAAIAGAVAPSIPQRPLRRLPRRSLLLALTGGSGCCRTPAMERRAYMYKKKEEERLRPAEVLR